MRLINPNCELKTFILNEGEKVEDAPENLSQKPKSL